MDQSGGLKQLHASEHRGSADWQCFGSDCSAAPLTVFIPQKGAQSRSRAQQQTGFRRARPRARKINTALERQLLHCLPRTMAGKGPPNELDYLQQPFSDANSCPDLIKGRGQQEDAESLCAAVRAGTCFRY